MQYAKNEEHGLASRPLIMKEILLIFGILYHTGVDIGKIKDTMVEIKNSYIYKKRKSVQKKKKKSY